MGSWKSQRPVINGRNHVRHLTMFMLISFLVSFAASSPAALKSGRAAITTPSTLLNTLKTSSTRIQQCREGCLEKFATKEAICTQNAECLSCWDECAKPPPPKIPKSIRETWSLYTVSMLQQDSLVLVDVAWAPLSMPSQCLVTWEVSGGGLMGNLLTESSSVQLSLWPETKYRVQVTCKNKLTGIMSRSLPLSIDTSEAVVPQHSDPILNEPKADQKLPYFNQKPIAPSTVRISNKVQPSSAIDSSNDDVINAKLSPPNESEVFTAGYNVEEEQNNEETDADEAVGSIEQEIQPILPYDDQSAETINQHTNFVFNWHSKNSDLSHNKKHNKDISAIEPLHKHNLNLMTLAALSDMQKPLMFGVIAGSLLLAIILFMYICMLRSNSIPNDKRALIAEDADTVVVSMPPTLHYATNLGSSKGNQNMAFANVGAAGAGTSAAANYAAEMCKNPAICSRNTIKV